jgi:hypothetical protein
MNNIGRTTLVFLTGLGIGAGIEALFALVRVKRHENGLPIERNGNLTCWAGDP